MPRAWTGPGIQQARADANNRVRHFLDASRSRSALLEQHFGILVLRELHTVDDVVASGFTFDGNTPANGFTKL